jgi:membrane-associated protease RseP (regulator of RpoE activity)
MIDILWYIGGIALIALGIGFSIGWHELGHLLPAKLFGVKVPRYMIGFGPTLFSRKRGETEYGVKAIPLGGYITMIGMYPPAKPGAKVGKGFAAESIQAAREAHSEHVGPGDKNRMFYQLPVLKRMVIMFGGPFMNLILGFALTFGVLIGIGSYERSTTIVEISQCVPSSFTETVECAATDVIGPAKQAGLLAGDVVTSVNGQEVRNWDQITEYALANPGALSFDVMRDGSKQSFAMTPVLVDRPSVTIDGKTITQKLPFFGVVLEPERQPQTFGEVLEYSGNVLSSTFELILTLPAQVVELFSSTLSGEARDASGPVSIVGIGQAAGSIASNSDVDPLDKLASGLMMLASLNFALFGFNMLPLLPLDGGHLAGAIYEALKKGAYRLLGKPNPGPADTALLMPLTYVVTALLIVMSLILLVVDLVNPLSLGF